MRRVLWVTQLVACLAAVGCGTHTDAPGSDDGPTPDACANLQALVAHPGARQISMPLQFQDSVVEAEAPPISGGTLIATRDGSLLVAADPDRDLIYVVEVDNPDVWRVVSLEPGDQPGRLVEDDHGHVHVALRGGRAIVSFDPRAESEVTRREVCDLPRGIAYESARDVLHVACAEGKLVSLSTEPTAEPQRVVELGRDLRDVVVRDSQLYVTRFRSAELLELDADGAVRYNIQPPGVAKTVFETEVVTSEECNVQSAALVERTQQTSPGVAWRTLAVPAGGFLMLHQQADDGVIRTTPGGYGGGFPTCGRSIVNSALSWLDGSAAVGGMLSRVQLAVDIALSGDGQTLAVVGPGNWAGSNAQLLVMKLFAVAAPHDAREPCVDQASSIIALPEQAVAVAFVRDDMLAVQTREPAGISFISGEGFLWGRLNFGQPSRVDTGHAMFHFSAGAGLSCASCHAEGGDDGHVWDFEGIGPRRTQALRGGILGSEPFHWDGDMRSFDHLVSEVFAGRMNGFVARKDQSDALANWIDRQPALQVTAADPAAVERGQALFTSEAVGCASCHSGPLLTNNESFDVGTGVKVQVPSLHNVSFRTPLMHDGCAPTLASRFESCGGGDQHGRTSQLSEAEIGDLIAYVETL